jgi:prophage regulatory protein
MIMSAIFIRSKQLTEMLSISRTTLWRMTRNGDIPHPINLSSSVVGWRRADIDSWLEAKVSKISLKEAQALSLVS